MKLDDIIALAKTGYKPSDIKELISLADTTPADENPLPPVEPAGENEGEPKDETQTEPDYKALYEKSQEDLKKAQKANVAQTVNKAEEKTDAQTFAEIMRGFM